MSAFVTCNLKLVDEEAIFATLLGLGYTPRQIERHENAQALYGYHADQRKECADIIVRRKFLTSASNDLGFVRQADKSYRMIVSQHDQGALRQKHKLPGHKNFETAFAQLYGIERVKIEASRRRWTLDLAQDWRSQVAQGLDVHVKVSSTVW